MSHLSPAQVELIDEYDNDGYSDDVFTARALELGMSHAQIRRAIADRLQADAIAAEELREERAANGQFGMGA